MGATGNGTTIIHAGLGLAARTRVIGGLEESLPVLQDDDLESDEFMEYLQGDLKELSPLEVEVHFLAVEYGAAATIELGTVGLVTVTWPDTKALAGTAFLHTRTGPTAQNNELLIGSYSVQFDGKATPPAYSAA
jgi:hypothetical protein